MEEKNFISSSADSNTGSSSSSSSNDRNQTDHLHLLKNLNKTSHKISKSHHHHHLNHTSQNTNTNTNNNNNNNNNNQQQPPVYNIDKSDFRQLVQKLTSSPSPPPNNTTTSRLHRIRPPPLAHVSNGGPPPPLFNDAAAGGAAIHDGRPRPPYSPLPPFPTVSIAAESPISAYLRYLRSSVPSSADADPQGSHNPSSLPPAATSPLALGHTTLASRSSQLGLQSPSAAGLPVPNPRWKDM